MLSDILGSTAAATSIRADSSTLLIYTTNMIHLGTPQPSAIFVISYSVLEGGIFIERQRIPYGSFE